MPGSVAETVFGRQGGGLSEEQRNLALNVLFGSDASSSRRRTVARRGAAP